MLPVSLWCFGIISVSHAKALGSRLAFYKNVVNEFTKFSESNLGKTPVAFERSNNSNQYWVNQTYIRNRKRIQYEQSHSHTLIFRLVVELLLFEYAVLICQVGKWLR